MDSNRYYIRKKLRKSWHRFFDHTTKFELKDLSMQEIRLAFAVDTKYMIINSSSGEFLIKNCGKCWGRKTQTFHLWLVHPTSGFRITGEDLSLSGVFKFIKLHGAKIYVMTSGGSPQPKEYSSSVYQKNVAEWGEELLESTVAQEILQNILRQRILKEFDSFDFYNLNSWETFKEIIDNLTKRGKMEISEIVRLYAKAPQPKYYQRNYDWKREIFKWEESHGETEAKRMFWEACKKYASNKT